MLVGCRQRVQLTEDFLSFLKHIYSNTSKLAIFGALKIANSRIWMLVKGTASLEVKSSERNRELENFASLEPRVCEVLLYIVSTHFYGRTHF